MSVSPGTRFGAYDVLAKLGEGGMGEVYRARDTKLGRDVALKVLPEAFASDPDRLMRFEREARTLASLNHPHIAQVYGIEDSPSTGSGPAATRALVMELVPGEDLSARIARGPLPLDEALAIAPQIAEALEAAHEAGIIHRDLKPANIKVRDDGTVKVLDFGLAKALDAPSGGPEGPPLRTSGEAHTITSPALTAHGIILGTAAYMAPEQAKGKPVDRRADIWAFGCVLYEMLTGQRAFTGDDITDTLTSVLRDEPDWNALPAGTPAHVRTLLRRSLQKDPRQRLPHVGMVRLELAEPAEPPLPLRADAAGRPPSRTAAWLVAATASAAALLLAWPAITHWREASPPDRRTLRLSIDAPAGARRLLSPEISPDGRAVAFTSITAGAQGPQLWIRQLDEAEPKLAPGQLQPGAAPFWSPDGRALAVPTAQGLVHLDLSSGATRRLTDLRATLAENTQFSGTWSAAGVLLYGLGSSLFQVSEGGGEARRVAVEGLPDGSDQRFPVFLPDGRRFLFLSSKASRSQLCVASIDGGPATCLFDADSQGVYTEPTPGRGYLLHLRDELLVAQPFDLATLRVTGNPATIAPRVPRYTAELLVAGRGQFSVSRSGVLVYRESDALQRLLWIDRSGREVGTVGEPALYFGPRVAPDRRRVAVARLDARTRRGDIYVLAEGASSQRLTFDDDNDLQPVWTPDGQYVIWGTERGGAWLLVRRRADGSGAEDILHRSEYSLAPDDVSTDGRTLVFRESHPETRNDLWTLSLAGGAGARPLVKTSADEPRARFSPDGRLIGYMSDASGIAEAYVQPFPAMDGKWQVTEGGGSVPQWRGDGREIYFGASGGVMVRPVLGRLPLQLGPAVRLFEGPATPRGSFFNATADGQRFLFAADGTGPGTLGYRVAIDWWTR